jgi:ornithine cyclodeaminase/alanine dehydrogenase-like protein (mu-crystallin family)
MHLEPLLYLSEADVMALCTSIDPLTIVEDALHQTAQGSAAVAPETALRWTAPDGTAARSLVLPARYANAYGCKVINACVGNPNRGVPRAHGLILLYDLATAAPMCIMDGGAISALRTAAVSAVAVRALRDPNTVRTLALLGCGRQATVHLELLIEMCANLQRVAVFDIDRERAARFAAHHRSRAAIQISAGAEAAVRDADLVVAVTTTTTPYIQLDWLQPGATFLNVSLDDATETLLLRCDHLIVDDWDLVRSDQHRLLGRLAHAGTVVGPAEPAATGVRQVDALLSTVVSGRYTRTIRPHDRVVVNPFGMGVHDVAIAAQVRSAAAQSGAGLQLLR